MLNRTILNLCQKTLLAPQPPPLRVFSGYSFPHKPNSEGKIKIQSLPWAQ